MTLIMTLIIAGINILTNHTMLTRKRSALYCAVAFFSNAFVVIIMYRYFQKRINDPNLYKYVFYLISFSFIAYIYFVFSDSFSIKLFSMFSVWTFSTIIIAISNMTYELVSNNSMNVNRTQIIRIILQLLLLGVSYFWYGNYYKITLRKIHTKVVYLMSGYMFIALLLLVDGFSWNHLILTNSISAMDLLFLIIFITIGYAIALFGISSASKNALLKQNVNTLIKQSDVYYKLANYDDLTGVATRQNVIKQMTLILENPKFREEKFMLFMFDVDKFKAVNDQYGHITGDIALKFVTKRVGNCLRDHDLIGRYGGDEFIIFLKNIHTRKDAEALIKRIKKSLEIPLNINKEFIYIDISIGVSEFPKDTSCIDELLDYADQAMYKAKKVKGTSYEFYEDL